MLRAQISLILCSHLEFRVVAFHVLGDPLLLQVLGHVCQGRVQFHLRALAVHQVLHVGTGFDAGIDLLDGFLVAVEGVLGIEKAFEYSTPCMVSSTSPFWKPAASAGLSAYTLPTTQRPSSFMSYSTPSQALWASLVCIFARQSSALPWHFSPPAAAGRATNNATNRIAIRFFIPLPRGSNGCGPTRGAAADASCYRRGLYRQVASLQNASKRSWALNVRLRNVNVLKTG